MTHDVIQRLEAYGEYADAVAPAISTDELDLRSAGRIPTRAPQRRVPNWAVAAGAAVAVFILIGGVVWLLGGTGSDVIEEPMPTGSSTTATSAPATTTIPETGVPVGSIEVTVEGIEGRSGGQLAGVLFEGEGTLDPDERAIGGFAVMVDSDPFTATELVRTLVVRTPRARGSGPEKGLFPDVTEEILVAEPGTYTVMLWLDDITIGYYSRWVPAMGHNLEGCEVVFEVEEGQGAALTVTGGFADVSNWWGKRCTTAP